MSDQNARFSPGAAITTENLVGLRHIANQLPIHKQKKVLNELAGIHTSALRGRGVDFSEVRSYQHGDDIRSMDWRVTARTGKPHIKVFREERERPVMVVCDLRRPMFFGTRYAFKSVLASDLCSLFAWSALNNGDRIGALLFDNQRETDIRPKPGRKQVMRLLHELTAFSPDQDNENSGRLAEVCRHLRRAVRPGSAIYFISDWAGFDEDCEQQLYQLSRHNDVVALNLFDAFEQQLPPPGSYPLTDGEERIRLESFSEKHRQQHKALFDQRLSDLSQRMLKLSIPLITLSAEQEDILEALRTGLGLGQKIREIR